MRTGILTLATVLVLDLAFDGAAAVVRGWATGSAGRAEGPVTCAIAAIKGVAEASGRVGWAAIDSAGSGCGGAGPSSHRPA